MGHSAVVREKDFSKLLQCLFQFDIDGRFGDNEECFCRILDNWKEIRGVLISKQPLAWAQMLDKKLGANELSCSNLSNINHYLVNMVFSEYQQICVLLENLDMSLVKTGQLRFCTKTGNVEFNGVSCVLAEPDSVRFLVLRKIMSSKAGRVKNNKLNEAINDFLEKKSKTNEFIDANQRKSLYSARNDINKKFQDLFLADFNLIEMSGGYCCLTEKVEIIRV